MVITKPAQQLLKLPRDQSSDKAVDLPIQDMTFGEAKGGLCCEEWALSTVQVVHMARRLFAREI